MGEPDGDQPQGDEWGTCMCRYDADGLLDELCGEHAMLSWQAEAIVRGHMDRELDQRLHAMFARTNLAPSTGTGPRFPVERKR